MSSPPPPFKRAHTALPAWPELIPALSPPWADGGDAGPAGPGSGREVSWNSPWGGSLFRVPPAPRGHLLELIWGTYHATRHSQLPKRYAFTPLSSPSPKSEALTGVERGIEGLSKAPGLRKQQDRRPPCDANALPSRYATQFIKLRLCLTFVLLSPWPPPAFYHLRLSQEIDGPQAEQLEFFPCGQILQDEAEEKLSPAQIRDHLFLILEVKETFPTTHVQKGSLEVKQGGVSTYP